MLSSSSNLGLPRKVVVYYLLFCLVAVCWLGVGILLTAHSVMDSRTTSAGLSKLGRTAAAIELDYVRHGTQNFQKILDEIKWSSGLKSYSVVSLEGTILAHSDSQFIGQPVVEHQGEKLRWGTVSGIQFQDELGRSVKEYRVPLAAQDDHFGSLRIAINQLSLWSSLSEIVKVAPLAVLLPLGLIAVGGWFLARLAQPVAAVEAQLRRIALVRPTADLVVQPLPAKDAISMGWNRVVGVLQSEGSVGTSEELKQRLAEVVAARGQGEMQSVLHNLADGVAVTDMEGRVTFANRAVAALLGSETSSDELAGIELEGHLATVVGAGDAGPIFAGATPNRPMVTEVQHQADGDERTLRVARLPREGDSAHGHVWSVRDVTQQKLTEQNRDQFIDAATHELRTPLSNIKAYAETLVTCDSIEVEQQKEFCNIINSEVTRLARFVDDLLSISSMEAGSMVIDRQPTISARLFEEVLDKVKPLMQQKNLEFIVDLPAKMDDLKLDKDKIVAVMVNLLGNAAKYTQENGRVTLRVKADEAQLQVVVEDTGLGIAPAELSKVFDKFFRSDDPRVQGETGTGLGLSLAREVIRMHGGDITVESQVGQGSTFMATIPIR